MEITDTKDVYLTIGNEDNMEGRGKSIILHVCESESTARRLGVGKYVMGTNCPVEKSIAVKIKNQWLIPGKIIEPTDKDIRNDTYINNKIKLIDRMKEKGFTEQEIKMLSGNII